MGNDIKIGSKIRDVEDGDAYFEGIVTQLNPLKYQITNIIWNGEMDASLNGQVIEPKWWIIELMENKGGDK
jgi:hypothetical protein